jgi:hypothetical protein
MESVATLSMQITWLAWKSHTWCSRHTRGTSVIDDCVERFNLICDGMWVHAMTVEQLVAVCNLAQE